MLATYAPSWTPFTVRQDSLRSNFAVLGQVDVRRFACPAERWEAREQRGFREAWWSSVLSVALGLRLHNLIRTTMLTPSVRPHPTPCSTTTAVGYATKRSSPTYDSCQTLYLDGSKRQIGSSAWIIERSVTTDIYVPEPAHRLWVAQRARSRGARMKRFMKCCYESTPTRVQVADLQKSMLWREATQPTKSTAMARGSLHSRSMK